MAAVLWPQKVKKQDSSKQAIVQATAEVPTNQSFLLSLLLGVLVLVIERIVLYYLVFLWNLRVLRRFMIISLSIAECIMQFHILFHIVVVRKRTVSESESIWGGSGGLL